MDLRYITTINIMAPSSDQARNGERGLMDPLLRGVCELYIDMKLEDSEIEKIRKLAEMLDLPVASKEDVSLGIFMGAIYSQLNTHYLKMYNRFPKKEDVDSYHQILQRRAEEIKSHFNPSAAPRGTLIPETTEDTPTEPKGNLDEYPLILQQKTEEIKAEIEKQRTSQEGEGQGILADDDSRPSGEFKFSYDMSTRKEPVRKIFGIPTKKEETVTPTT
jgi:hypothetical protein